MTLDEANGLLTLNEITDEALVGIHTIAFEVYLIDLDPAATLSRPLDLVLTVEIVKPAAEVIGETFADVLVSSGGPTALTSIEKSYTVDLEEQSELFTFEFASALALSEEGEDAELGDLEIRVITNSLTDIVSVLTIEKPEDGYGRITLSADGSAAKALIDDSTDSSVGASDPAETETESESDSDSKTEVAAIEEAGSVVGYITIEVKD